MSSQVPLTSEAQMNKFRLRDKMSLLNAEFLKVLNGYYTEKNHFDFTATMLSYMDHVKQLKTMYNVDDPPVATTIALAPPKPQEAPKVAAPKAPKPTEDLVPTNTTRRFAKAVRKNNGAVDSPKAPLNSTVFAASSPANVPSLPKFGDISVIAKETPAPIKKTAPIPTIPEDAPAPAAPPAARKRAIRGGGVCGGSESVIFKGANGEEKTNTSTAKIPEMTIKFPTPSKDFWAKSTVPASSSGSLFAFLGKDGDKTPETSKFTGFSFGKKPSEGGAEEEKKKDEPIPAPVATKPSLFGASTASPLKFGASTSSTTSATSDDAAKPPLSFGGAFGAKTTPSSSDGAAATKPLSFGSSLFGASSSGASGTPAASEATGAAPALSFGGGSSLFSGLAQKAMENKQAAAGGDDDEAEYVPPKAETVENEEPDAVLTSKVSVFKFSGKEYAKLGIGMLHVKNTDGKHSVLIRAATTTGTVWLNAACNAAMKATKLDEKGDRIRLTCPVSTSEMVTMMIRFGTADGAKKFTDKVEEVSK